MTSMYYMNSLCAYVRGYDIRTGELGIPSELLSKPLTELTEDEGLALFERGRAAGLKLYRFKNTHDLLPRVKRVIGFLRSISFDTLLDVGSGRGVFLLPFLDAFPWVTVASADILDYRVEFLNDIARGGIDRLSAAMADICSSPLPEKSVDVVTLLEVLEHIPSVGDAVKAAVRTARKFVVVTVPSKEDSNPEHIHLLTKARLTELFRDAGCESLSFDGVNGHLVMIANVGGKNEL